MKCPDGGTCHHDCGQRCFRTSTCGPLSGVYPNDKWPQDVLRCFSHRPVKMLYTNYRGETSVRKILPIDVWYASTEWHPEEQWLLTAWDVDKQERRDFALRDCNFTVYQD